LSYDKKDELNRKRYSAGAPYFKLKLLMDYWCSLWFWDFADAMALPTREQYLNDLINLLEITDEEVNKYITDQTKTAINNGFGAPQPIQTNIFGNEPQQLILGQQIRKREKSTVQKALVDLSYKSPDDLFAENNRFKIVKTLSEKYRFFHYQLEFIEVFQERGGFDIINGNPPWVKVTFEEGELLSEVFPEIILRKEKAPEIALRRPNYLKYNKNKSEYFSELLTSESTGVFLNSKQNYPLLEGQQTDLYRCVISNSFSLVSKDGYIGLIHPESVYDDPNGSKLRKESYRRLKFHFQFKNELKLFDIHHENIYSLNIYSGSQSEPSFYSIHNLFHPSTISASFLTNSQGKAGGIKKIKENGKSAWNTDPHFNRIILFEEKKLRMLAKTFEDSDEWEGTKLASIHSIEILDVIYKLRNFSGKIMNHKNIITEGWHETNDINIFIKRKTDFPDYDKYEMIYNGPHFFVSTPFYKTPRSVCDKNQDFDNLYYTDVDEDYFPRTNYFPIETNEKFKLTQNGFNPKEYWIDYYKVAMSKMLSLTGERSLQPAIISPKVSHVNGVISVTFFDESNLIEFAGLASSIVLDFYVKSIGASNLTDGKLKYFPLGIDEKYYDKIAIRILLLNCMNKSYLELWNRNYNEIFKSDTWSKKDFRLKSFTECEPLWNRNSPLRNFFERRQALTEIDVISAMALGLSLDELILIYNIQFPVLQSYEENTFYDQTGNVVFTNNSQGLKAVGVDSVTFNSIKDLKAGETYEHTIDPKKSELYGGKKIIYYAPFDKCDRVEDYKVAWEHFERVFNKTKM
jgi:hypothetical protein